MGSVISNFVHSNLASLIEVVVLIWIVAMIVLFYLYWKKGRFDTIGKNAKAVEQKVIAATGKIYCPKCATKIDASKPCTNCGYDLKTTLTTAPEAPTPTITATATTTEMEFGHGFKIRGHGGLIDNLQEVLLPASLASLKNNGNGTKDQSVPQTTMIDPTTSAPETTAATPKNVKPTLDQLVEQKITLLPNMDTGQLISLKTEVDTQVETYQDAITELNTELGPYRQLQKATTRNLITKLVKDGTIDLNSNPELKSLINAPPEDSQIIDTSKSLPADHPAVISPPAVAPAPAKTLEPPKSESAPHFSRTVQEPQEQAADQTTAMVPLQESQAEGVSPSPPAEEPTPSGEPTELGNTEPITNVKKPKGGRSRKRKRQEASPPDEPKDDTGAHETAVSSGSDQQALVVQTFENQMQDPNEAPSEDAPEEHATEEEIGDHGFFVNQNSTDEEAPS